MYPEQAWIYKRALLTPKKIALIDSHTGDQWSYTALADNILKWVHYFQACRFKKGERIVVLSQNRIELFPILFACGMTGLIYVPLNFRQSKRDLQFIIEDCEPVLLIHDHAHQAVSERLNIERLLLTANMNISSLEPVHYTSREATDAWLMIYTGGTTGRSKGAVVSFEAVSWNAINTIISWGLSEADCTLNYMPMFHTGGLNALCIPVLMAGGTVVIGNLFQAEEALKYMNTYKTTISLFVPTMYQAMIETDYFKTANFPTVKVFLSGGAPCPKVIYQKFAERGLLFKEGYGLTEAGPNNFFIQPEIAAVKQGSVGKCMQFNQVKIINESGEICKEHEIGELYITGKHLFTKYWNNEEETNRTLVDGWLKTGDFAKVDEDGDYYIVGRKKEMIISGGENIYPQEVEQCLMLQPIIREAAVIGVPDEKWGEYVHAFVSCKKDSEINGDIFINHCKRSLGSYKVPKKVTILNELPRTDVGKIDKKELLALAEKA